MNKRRSTAFSIEVRKRLIDLGKTQRELANEIGMSEYYLARVLNGQRSGKKWREKIIENLGLKEVI